MIQKSKEFVEERITKKLPWLIYPSMILLGLYGGFIQVGIGFLIMHALHNILKMKLVYVNMHKVFIVMLYTIPALLIFICTGNVNWFLGLSLAGGSWIGAWWAAKISVKKGENFIKGVLIVAIIIMSLKLLGGF